jgi:F-type H+-transporting ATPase subunit delta
MLSDLIGQLPEFRWLLESPVIVVSEKIRIAGKMFSGLVEPVTLDFLALLIRQRREANLASTCRMFMELYRTDRGIIDARVESAVKVDDAFLETLKKRLEKASGKSIEMTSEVNDDLIGGFILTLEDQQLDASVQSKLRRIKQELRESKK